MRFTETLCDLGSAVPSVLADIVSRGAGASALECIRQLACSGERNTLADPPPALLHPAKMATTNLLHSARKPCPLRDGPYLSISDKTFFEGALTGVCVGGLTIDVTAMQSRPAVVFARTNEAERRLEILVHVYAAPFAAMEAELFSGAGAPSAFERRWLAERAAADKDVRAQAGQYVRTRGMDEMPEWLHQDRYALERPGALILLRAHLPTTDKQRDDLRAALESETCPSGGVFSLRDLLHQFSPAGLRVTMRTIFHARPLSDKPERGPAARDDCSTEEGSEGCAGAVGFSVIGPLALLVLKHMEPENFYGVDAGEADAKEWEAPAADENEAREVEEDDALNDVLDLTDQAGAAAHASTGPSIYAADTPMRLLAPTLRPTDVKLVVNTNTPLDAVQAIARAFFFAEDLPKVNLLLQGRHDACVHSAIAALGMLLGQRFAILFIEKTDDGRARRCTLFSSKGEWIVSPHEAVARYVLFPWVTPLIFDGASVNEVQVHAVTREALRLPYAANALSALGAASAGGVVQKEPRPVDPSGQVGCNAAAELSSLVLELRKATSDLTAAAIAASASSAKSAPKGAETALMRSLKRTIAYLDPGEDSASV